MEYVLLLDAYSNQKVAVLGEGKILSENSSNLPHSDTFMKLIDQTLLEAGVSVNDIDKIALNIGPGSFTGIRVATSIAKGLGFDSKIKYCTYNSFDLVDSKKDEVVLIHGFSNFVYIKHDFKMDCVAYDMLEKSKRYVTNSQVVFDKVSAQGLNVRLALNKPLHDIYKNIASQELKINQLNPLYLRKSQAEIQREQKVGK